MVTITRGQNPQFAHLLDPSYGIPSDVTFRIIGINKNGVDEDEEVLGEVEGHKIVLGAFSRVFRDKFCGSMKGTKEVIPVKETTLEAFEKMVFYIYKKDIEWGGLSVSEMYDVVNLAEKYHLAELMDEMKTQMGNLTITVETLMEIAHTTAQFSHLFPIVSPPLLLRCAKFLQITFRTPAEKLQFATDQYGGGQEVTAMQLLVMARDLPPLPLCSNCGMDVEQCKDGQLVTATEKLTLGLKLRINKENNYWGVNSYAYAGQAFTVVSLDYSVKIKGAWSRCYTKIKDGSNTPLFLYNCH
eukprot:GFUD01030382.1.p1 GENE.GFUD01030382.1~~GFUD01030382.1.p1  ORF type:complete len:299 (+),score=64.12 GFUD01030382.1:44-940(+)